MPKIISHASVIPMEYEICYLVGDSKETDADKIKKNVEKIITSKGGSFSGIEFIDKRKMAYMIGKEDRGIYFARRFKLPIQSAKKEDGNSPKENSLAGIVEKLNLNPEILRFTIVKAVALPPLKSREDMEREAEKRRTSEFKKERENKPKGKAAVSRKGPAAKKGKEKKAESQNDIDKKLEEILNI